jgi:ABC-2 type transport system permease protein
MNQILGVAADEWRYWRRSHLALGGAIVFLVLVISTSFLNMLRIDAETETRSHQQTQAEDTFLAQPDRHPHRMVHYGHYVFRAPAPLAIFDPGLDFVTGQSIFLEGHRQNTAMFAESSASADLGGLSYLSPALIYQLFAPLIIILLAHGAIVREREAGMLVSLLSLGLTGNRLLLGKALALLSFIVVLLLPLVLTCSFAVAKGETLAAVLSLFAVYLVYLVIWGVLTLGFSAIVHTRGTALAALAGLWFVLTLVLPSVAVNIAANQAPVAGKIETDLALLSAQRGLSDGHNANDPAFAQLRSELLEKYGVQKLEDLPVNIRGLVSTAAEEKLTKVLNEYAEKRMAGELRQEHILTMHAWLAPSLAISFVSRSIAGTDLAHYHRFQKEAEALRFSFVQRLNRAHAEKVAYEDDINRNKDEESWQRVRVSAANWQVLDTYEFQTASLPDRISNSVFSLQILLIWLMGFLCLLMWTGWRIKP